jgi:hypothetical protein
LGQKVNPIGFRTGIMIGWKSRWYASKQEYADLLIEDHKIRDFIKNRKDKFDKPVYPSIAKIEIERTRDEVKVILFSARPGACLDEPTARALAVGRAVLDRLDCFDAPSAQPVRDIMARSLQLTISDAAASFPARYTPACLGELKRRSPFRLACLAAERQRLTKAKGSLTGLLEAWIAEDAELPPAVARRLALAAG